MNSSSVVLDLTHRWGTDDTVLAGGSLVAKMLDITDGYGAETVIDVIGEASAEHDAVKMVHRASSRCIISYDGSVNVPPIDIISTAINFIGNPVGTYRDLTELMTLTDQGKMTYPLDAIHDLDSGKLRGRGILIA